VLNTILSGTGVHAVIPAMMQLGHLAENVRAVEQCRFTLEELALLRAAMR
jgi:aryl-alcohol dehydrogenase-like predicted oxidoreductase